MQALTWIQPLHLFLALNALAMVASAWTALLATRRADRWQAVAQGVVRRERDPSTARTRVWFKRDTPGQRLSRFVER